MGHPSVGCDGCRAGDAHNSDGTTGFLLGRVKNAKEGEQAGSTVENRADNTAGSHHLSIERRTVGYEGLARAAEHDGIFKSNFTAGRRRKNSSVAFGKEAVGNELLVDGFFGNDALPRYSLGRQLHDGEVLR